MTPEPKPKSKFKRISFDLPAPAPQEEAKPAVGKSIGGFAENIIDDAFSTIKGIGEGIVMAVPRAGKAAIDIWNDRDYWGKLAENPQFLTKELKNTGNNVVDAITAPYREHGADVLYHRPVGTLLDLVTVISLGGGSIAKMGKIAGNTKLEAIGRAIAESPSKVANKLLIDPAFKAVGIDRAKRSKFLSEIKGTEKGRASVMAQADMEAVGKKIQALNDEEAKLFHKVRTQGASAAEMAKAPKVAEAIEGYRSLVRDVWQKELKARHLLDDERIEGALVKKYASEAFGDTSKENVLRAKAAIDEIRKAKGVEPVYGPAIFERKGGYTADDILVEPQVQKVGKVGFLEEFKGAQGAITDPRVYIPKAIKGFRDVEGQLRMVERALQQPGWFKTAGAGGAKMGEAIPSHGIFSKYFEDNARVKAQFLRELVEETGSFESAMKVLKGDAGTRARMKAASTIVADPTIRRLLAGEFYRQGGPLGAFLRIYDKILGMFKSSATILNPKWYTGNIVGDAVLGQMAGVTIGDMKFAKKLFDSHGFMWNPKNASMPPQLMAKGAIAAEQSGFISRKLEKMGEFTAEIDNAFRAGILTKTVRDKLMATGTNFYELENSLKSILQAPLNISNMEVQLQLLMEEGVRKVPRAAWMEGLIEKRTKELEKALRYVEGKKPIPQDPIYGTVARGTKNKVSEAKVKETLKRIDDIRDEIAAVESQKQAIAADYADDMIRAGRLDQAMPGMREQAAIAHQGINRANAFLGDYLALGPIEQGIFRRVVPFYVWGKAMTMLAFRLPFIAPGATFAWHKYAAAMATMHNDEELPQWLAGYIPVMATKEGNQVWAKMTSLSPFGGLRRSRFADIPIPAVANALTQNPFINLVYKFGGGKDEFDSTSLPYGEPMVKISTGDVYEFKDDGTLEKTIPQVPLIKGVVNMWPVVQMIDQVISRYDVRKGPELKPDGTYKYPREFWDTLVSMVGPRIMRGNREEFIRNEKLKIKKNIMELKYAYRRADPERQEFIRNALREYAEGSYRKIAQK